MRPVWPCADSYTRRKFLDACCTPLPLVYPLSPVLLTLVPSFALPIPSRRMYGLFLKGDGTDDGNYDLSGNCFAYGVDNYGVDYSLDYLGHRNWRTDAPSIFKPLPSFADPGFSSNQVCVRKKYWLLLSKL